MMGNAGSRSITISHGFPSGRVDQGWRMIGSIVAGRYRILARIGSGGAGEVYEAEDLELPRKVAIKFLAPVWNDDRRLRQRFVREAEALSALDHPHICTIYKAGETDEGRLFIAMALYDGETLRARLARGRMGTTEALAVAAAVADGMQKAHRLGFLHRDLKPGNVILTDDGVVKVLDFGLAKLPEHTQVTETGTTMGTLAYVSPEQARGEKLDARSDVYSLGVMLYQMFSGVCPFSAPTAPATLALVLEGRPRPLGELRPDLPRAVLDLVGRCIESDPARRPNGMTEVRDGILAALVELSPETAARLRTEHVDSIPDGIPAARRRRRPVAVILAALILAVFVVARWDTVGSVLGIARGPDNRGVALLPLGAEGSSDRDARLAAGARSWLSTQLQLLTQADPEIWLLPEWEAGESSVEHPGRRFGVESWIDGTTIDDEGEVHLTLRLHDGSDGRVRAEERWILGVDPDSTRSGPGPLDWFVAALGIEVDEARSAEIAASCTTAGPALRPFLIGAGALRQEQPAEALPALEAARRADPDFSLATLFHAAALLGTATGDSLRLQRAALEIDELAVPTVLEPLRASLRARASEAQGNRDEADLHWRAALLAAPLDLDLCWGRAANLISAGDFGTARLILEDGIAANPEYPGGYRALGYVYWRENDYSAAIEQFDRAVQLTPDDWMLWNYLGASWFALEEWENAIRMFRRSFDLHRNYQAIANLGTLYYLERDYESALEMSEWALDYRPDSYSVVGNIASALQWIEGREDEARERFAEAARMAERARLDDPRNPRLLADLAGYYSTADTALALSLAEEALRLAPDDSSVLFDVAVVYEQATRRTRALTLLGRAMDHGLSLRHVHQEKYLDALREDPRFRILLPGP